MKSKKIQKQLVQHHRMLKVRDFVTNFAALSLFAFGLYVLCIVL